MRDPATPPRRSVPGGSRAGFTLVELLVVMVIIGILVALLLPAIGVARASVQESTMTTEVAMLSQALQAFKTQYQCDFPPDFSGRAVVSVRQAEMNQFLGRLFRYRNPATDLPPDPRDPTKRNARWLEFLDPAEALYLWLRGFSDDPANPLFGRPDTLPDQVARTPLFEFDKTRLADQDGDGFLEFYPRYAKDRPYVYYVHYNYLNAFASPELVCRRGIVTAAMLPAPRPYLSSTVTAIANPLLKNSYAAADKFQIICAGLDNDFGTQVSNESKGSDLMSFSQFVFPAGPYPDKAHKDNITSFAEGTLEDRQP